MNGEKEIDEEDVRKGYKNHPILKFEDIVESIGEYITESIVKMAEWSAFDKNLDLEENEGLDIRSFFDRFNNLALIFLLGLHEEMQRSKELVMYHLEQNNETELAVSRIDFATWMRINAILSRRQLKKDLKDFKGK